MALDGRDQPALPAPRRRARRARRWRWGSSSSRRPASTSSLSSRRPGSSSRRSASGCPRPTSRSWSPSRSSRRSTASTAWTSCGPSPSPQLSSVELIFDRGVDLLEARQLVQERMTAVSATLPTWAAPPVMLAPASATSRAVKIGMTSNDQSLIQMSMTAYWTIRARLLQVPGVANVTLWGERLQMMQVQVRPDAMPQRDVSLDQVMETTAEAVDSGLLLHDEGSIIGPGGIVETPNQRLNVRSVLPIITPDDLAQVPIETAPPPVARGRAPEAGTRQAEPAPIVRLGDVADVVEDHQPLLGDGAVNDEPRPDADRREAAVGRHRRADPRRRGRRQDAGAEPAQHPVRLDDLPAGELHPDGDRQPHRGDRAGLPAGRGDPGAVPVRVAGGADQPADHPAVDHGDAAGAATRRTRRSTR